MSFSTIANLNQHLWRARAVLASARHALNSMQQIYSETMAMQGLELENMSRSILAGEPYLESERVTLVDIMLCVRIQWLFSIENQQRTVANWQAIEDQLVAMRDREIARL